MANEIPMAKCQEVAKHCAGFSVRRAARAVANLYDEVLAPCGLRGTQFTLLNAIAVAGRPTITRLADLLLMDRTTLTRNLKPLAQQGLVRISSGQDRRAKDLTLTPAGVKTMRRALPLWEKAQHTVETRLGQARLARLRNDLSELEQLTIAG
jgi:DNA-binding MarR family transcriptional regulator